MTAYNDFELLIEKMLREVANDDEFVSGIIDMASGVPHGLEIIKEYIERGEDVDMTQICLLTIDLLDGKVPYD